MAKAAFATATFMDSYKGDVAMQLVGSPSKRRGERVTIWQWMPVSVGGVYAGYHPVTSAMRAVRNARVDHRFKHVELTDIGAVESMYAASTRPGDQAAIVAKETGMSYSASLAFCNID